MLRLGSELLGGTCGDGRGVSETTCHSGIVYGMVKGDEKDAMGGRMWTSERRCDDAMIDPTPLP